MHLGLLRDNAFFTAETLRCNAGAVNLDKYQTLSVMRFSGNCTFFSALSDFAVKMDLGLVVWKLPSLKSTSHARACAHSKTRQPCEGGNRNPPCPSWFTDQHPSPRGSSHNRIARVLSHRRPIQHHTVCRYRQPVFG